MTHTYTYACTGPGASLAAVGALAALPWHLRNVRLRRKDGISSAMKPNRDIVTDAFRSWANGDGYVASIFADDMTWEITGRSAVSKKYADTQQFIDEVLHPFGARFSSGDPFRPVNIRAIYDDEDNSTVIVVWDGRGTTTAGTTYHNTYAWFMTLSGGKVIDGTAFYDSIAFNELWDRVTP
jgi:ketosteroid isomerase-like protein